MCHLGALSPRLSDPPPSDSLPGHGPISGVSGSSIAERIQSRQINLLNNCS